MNHAKLLSLGYGVVAVGGVWAGLHLISLNPFLKAWLLAGFVVVTCRLVFAKVTGRTTGGAVIDIQELAKNLQRYQAGYDPTPLIKKTPADQVFLGLRHDRGSRPVAVRVPASTIRKNHIQLLGVSGTGKSSLAGLLLGQMTARGDAVVVFDPKDDRNLPHVLASFTRRMYVIDLRPDAPPQLNPLVGASQSEVEEMLNAALQLDPSGDAAVDFHRGEDRDASLAASRLGAASLPELAGACAARDDITERKNFWRELRQLAELPAFATREGLDLAQAIADGAVIYVIGSCDNMRVITAQKLLLQRVLQLVKKRSVEDADRRPVMLMLDELKYLLSNSALRAAGTVRDRNCHLLVAHQSLQDLEDCGGLNPRAVVGAIHGNTAIKIVYRVLDTRTAKELSDGSGQQRVWAESTDKAVTDGVEGGGYRESGRAHIPVEMLTSLPKPEADQAAVGVVFGLPPAFILSTRWMKPLRKAPQPVAAPALPESVQTTEELI